MHGPRQMWLLYRNIIPNNSINHVRAIFEYYEQRLLPLPLDCSYRMTLNMNRYIVCHQHQNSRTVNNALINFVSKEWFNHELNWSVMILLPSADSYCQLCYLQPSAMLLHSVCGNSGMYISFWGRMTISATAATTNDALPKWIMLGSTWCIIRPWDRPINGSTCERTKWNLMCDSIAICF